VRRGEAKKRRGRFSSKGNSGGHSRSKSFVHRLGGIGKNPRVREPEIDEGGVGPLRQKREKLRGKNGGLLPQGKGMIPLTNGKEENLDKAKGKLK